MTDPATDPRQVEKPPGDNSARLDGLARVSLVSRLALVVSILLVGRPSAYPSRRIDALLAPFSGDRSPGAAVMVIRHGVVVYTATVGMADIERNIPIGPRTMF